MKKFILAVLIVLMLGCMAAAESAPADGLYSIGVSSNARMFKIVDCILEVEDGKMTARITMSSSGYGYLYPGTSAEAGSAPMESWLPHTADEEGRHCFEMEIPALDTPMEIASWSIRYEKWYDRTVEFFSNTLSEYDLIAPEGVYTAVIESDTELDGKSCILRSADGKMTMEAEGFSMELSSLDEKIPVDGGWLRVDGKSLEEYSLALADGSYTAQTRTDSGLLKFIDCVLTVENGDITALLTTKNNNFDYLYLGTSAEARADEANRIAAIENADGAYTYEIPVPIMDNAFTVATYSGKKKLWYDRELTILSEGMARIEAEAILPDAFSFSGGTGRVAISCRGVEMNGNQAAAIIEFSSPNYGYVKVDGETYYPIEQNETSLFEIPVRLNQSMEITGMTTAMSSGHEVAYEIFIRMGDAEHSEIPGLIWEDEMQLTYAEGFSVEYYQGGYALIDVVNEAKYLVVPENMPVPDGLDPQITVLEQPLQNIYLAATSAMALFDAVDALDSIRLSGTRPDGWYIENAKEAMERGDILFAGSYSEPDYELLIRENCGLAIESTMIYHQPKVKEMIQLLGIPVFVDRSSYEAHPLGRTEWVKLYAVLSGKEQQAEAFFNEQAKVIEELKDFGDTEKTVAFFYVSSDGTVNVRSSSDYIPKMIEIAGGRYIFDDLTDPESSRSTMSLTMEEFYAAAVDADYIIYNATIDDPISSMDELIAKSTLFADFKAVKNGNVWCTGKYLYQATDIVGSLITDINHMLTDDADDMTFIYKLS